MSRAEAKLYEVRTPRGTVYAVHQLATNTFWTERAEPTARQSARERGRTLVGEQSVSLEEFLRLTGRQPITAPPVPESNAHASAQPAPPPPAVVSFETLLPSVAAIPAPATRAAQPLAARYFLEGEPPPVEDGIVTGRPAAAPPTGIFSDTPRPDAVQDDDPPGTGNP